MRKKKPGKRKLRINNKSLIHAIGGARKFARAHAAIASEYGFKPLPEDTIRSWINRGIMKYERLSEIYIVAAQQDIILDLRDFVELLVNGKWVSFSSMRLCFPPEVNQVIRAD